MIGVDVANAFKDRGTVTAAVGDLHLDFDNFHGGYENCLKITIMQSR